MRKAFIISLSALAVLSGCSKVQEQPAGQAYDDAWKYDESLPVPIIFSNGPEVSVDVKAMYEGNVMKNLPVGIFALATEYEESGSPGNTGDDKHLPLWNTSLSQDGSIIPGEGVLMSNTRVVTGENGEIEFSEPQYYPFDKTYAYSFYSYCPHHKVTYEDGWYKAAYSVGYDDIMWAESHAEPYTDSDGKVFYGYNSDYIRATGKNGDESHLPSLNYEHLLTGLNFTAEFDAPEEFTIVNFYLESLPTKVALRIAGNSSVDPDGSGAGTFEVLERERLYILKDGKADIEVDSSSPEIGTLMVLPAGPGEELYATVVVRDNANPNHWTYRSERIPFSHDEGFKAGERYKITVKVLGREGVKILNSGLTGWKDWEELETE